MQPTLAPTRAPDPPAAPSAPGQTEASAVTATVPRTAQELAGLRQQRDELVQQLMATHSRRQELVGEMESTDPGARGVLKQQMTELDRRVLRLETDVSNVDHAIASAPPSVAAVGSQVFTAVQGVAERGGFRTGGGPGQSRGPVPGLLIALIILQVFSLLRGRRARSAATEPILRDAAAQLARVEQAVDAIAIEVERVSEGQRFVTRALGADRAATAYLDQQAR